MTRLAAAIVPLVLALAALLTACGGDAPPPTETAERPDQALEAIAALFEAGDFDALVRTRYAEIEKAENEEQIEGLVARFGTRFADDATRAEAVAIYRSLRGTAPELSAEGDVATFRVGDGFVKLSRMADGRWGFHL